MGVIMVVVFLAVIVILIAAHWRIHVKAGKPGWACLVPVYNLIVMPRDYQKTCLVDFTIICTNSKSCRSFYNGDGYSGMFWKKQRMGFSCLLF